MLVVTIYLYKIHCHIDRLNTRSRNPVISGITVHHVCDINIVINLACKTGVPTRGASDDGFSAQVDVNVGASISAFGFAIYLYTPQDKKQ